MKYKDITCVTWEWYSPPEKGAYHVTWIDNHGDPTGHEWWVNGALHREDGPAIEYPNGSKEWWLNDVAYTKQEYYKELYNLGKISYSDLMLELL